MYRFEKLNAWQKAMDFCVLAYRKSNGFPKEEIYGLTSQFRRAVTSISLNITEGSACNTKKEFIKFLGFSLRSQYETVTIIKLAKRLKFLNNTDYSRMEEDIAVVGKLIQGLINSLKGKSKNQKQITKN
jgi:four helix bundle protein